eukprot:3256386-Rhodomonas_salina.5
MRSRCVSHVLLLRARTTMREDRLRQKRVNGRRDTGFGFEIDRGRGMALKEGGGRPGHGRAKVVMFVVTVWKRTEFDVDARGSGDGGVRTMLGSWAAIVGHDE